MTFGSTTDFREEPSAFNSGYTSTTPGCASRHFRQVTILTADLAQVRSSGARRPYLRDSYQRASLDSMQLSMHVINDGNDTNGTNKNHTFHERRDISNVNMHDDSFGTTHGKENDYSPHLVPTSADSYFVLTSQVTSQVTSHVTSGDFTIMPNG